MPDYDLDRIIKRVIKHTPVRKNQALVPVRVRGTWFGKIYFLVTYGTVVDQQEVSIPIEDFDAGWKMALTCRYQVQCIDGSADLVAEALCHGDNPDGELREYIRNCAREYILDKADNTAFVREFKNYKGALEEHIGQKARAIGLKLSGHFSLPRRSVELKVVDERFGTCEQDFKIAITVKCQARVPESRRISADPGGSCETTIEKFIREELLRPEVQKCTPKQMYMNFEDSGLPEFGGRPIRDHLVNLISNNLREKFDAEIINVECERNGELWQTLKALREQNPLIKVELTRALIPVSVGYHILDVVEQQWHRFQSTSPSVDVINRKFSHHLEQYFADIDPISFVNAKNMHFWNTLNDDLKGPVGWLKSEFGLKVVVDHWIRDSTIDEKLQRETRDSVVKNRHYAAVNELASTSDAAKESNAIYRRGLLEQQTKLQDRLSRLHVPDDKDEIADVTRQLEEIRAKLAGSTDPILNNIVDTASDQQLGAVAAQLGQGAPNRRALKGNGTSGSKTE